MNQLEYLAGSSHQSSPLANGGTERAPHPPPSALANHVRSTCCRFGLSCTNALLPLPALTQPQRTFLCWPMDQD
jgi:hypothetical protein